MSLPFWWIKKPIGVEVKATPEKSELKVFALRCPPHPSVLTCAGSNVQWQVLSGAIYHETGTNTIIIVVKGLEWSDPLCFCHVVPSTSPSYYYPLDLHSNSLILREGYSILLDGAANCTLHLHVLQIPLV